jgi:hypothetical protein
MPALNWHTRSQRSPPRYPSRSSSRSPDPPAYRPRFRAEPTVYQLVTEIRNLVQTLLIRQQQIDILVRRLADNLRQRPPNAEHPRQI